MIEMCVREYLLCVGGGGWWGGLGQLWMLVKIDMHVKHCSCHKEDALMSGVGFQGSFVELCWSSLVVCKQR